MDELVKALQAEITKTMQLPCILLPQEARTDTGHIELLFLDVEQNGENGEKLTMQASYVTAGTHRKWLSETLKAKRALVSVEQNGLPFTTPAGIKLKSYWKRNGKPQWVYPEDDDGAMPAKYVAPYTVEIDYPSATVTEV